MIELTAGLFCTLLTLCWLGLCFMLGLEALGVSIGNGMIRSARLNAKRNETNPGEDDG